MKARTSVSIIGAAIASAVLLFGAAFLAQAASVDISNFKYEREDEVTVTIQGVNYTQDYWVFSWDTVAGQGDVSFQVKGGGIVNGWVGIRGRSVKSVGNKTEFSMTPLNTTAGSAISFRVRVKTANGAWTNWAVLNLSQAPS